ncbi:MAG: vWA domain-containing protein, partial [Methyloligellaceae bacterium]
MQKHRGLQAALATAIACLLISGAPAGAADDGPAVKLRAELGRDTILKGTKDRVYLRIDLAGLVHARPPARPPVNVAIALDRSGPMKGAKIAQAKEAAINAMRRLARHDVVSVAYDHLNVSVIVLAHGIEQLAEYLDRKYVNRVILLSDGLANVGPRSPRAIGELAAEQGISITTIGLGLGYNEDLMAKLAFASDGNHAFVEHAGDLAEIFDREFGDVLSVVAQDVEVTITCHVGIRPIRVLGRKVKVSGGSVKVRLNQLYARQKKYLI